MEKIINEVKYYIPNNLTLEQKAIYVHIIDWKRKNITTDRGLYRGHEYDALSRKIRGSSNDVQANYPIPAGNAKGIFCF